MSIIKKTDSFRAKKVFTDTENVTPSFAAVETIAKKGGESTRIFNSSFDSSCVTQSVVYCDSTGTFKLGLADGTSAMHIIGLADIVNSEVITSGVFEGLQGFNSGDVLWLSETIRGGMTTIEPSTYKVRIGTVFYSSSKQILCLLININFK